MTKTGFLMTWLIYDLKRQLHNNRQESKILMQQKPQKTFVCSCTGCGIKTLHSNLTRCTFTVFAIPMGNKRFESVKIDCWSKLILTDSNQVNCNMVIHTRNNLNTRLFVVTIAVIHTRHNLYTRVTAVTIAVIYTRNNPYTRFTVVPTSQIHIRNNAYIRVIVVTITVFHTRHNPYTRFTVVR